jgi:hypothetical protein
MAFGRSSVTIPGNSRSSSFDINILSLTAQPLRHAPDIGSNR